MAMVDDKDLLVFQLGLEFQGPPLSETQARSPCQPCSSVE